METLDVLGFRLSLLLIFEQRVRRWRLTNIKHCCINGVNWMLSYKLKRVKGRCCMRDTCGLCVRVISGGPYELAYL